MSCHAFARIWNEMNGNKMGKFRIHFDNLAVAVDDVECRVCVLQILIRPDNELQYTRWRFIAIVFCCAKTVHIANQAWGERQCVCVCVREWMTDLSGCVGGESRRSVCHWLRPAVSTPANTPSCLRALACWLPPTPPSPSPPSTDTPGNTTEAQDHHYSWNFVRCR